MVVIYTTGSTFGTRYGCGEIEGVYLTKEEALAVKESINNDTYQGYACWKGYFEDLEDCRVYKRKINESVDGEIL